MSAPSGRRAISACSAARTFATSCAYLMLASLSSPLLAARVLATACRSCRWSGCSRCALARRGSTALVAPAAFALGEQRANRSNRCGAPPRGTAGCHKCPADASDHVPSLSRARQRGVRRLPVPPCPTATCRARPAVHAAPRGRARWPPASGGTVSQDRFGRPRQAAPRSGAPAPARPPPPSHGPQARSRSAG